MYITIDTLLILLKYAVAVAIVVGIFLAPAYLARVNKKDKYNMLLVRVFSWLFGWTGVGWLVALIWASRK